MNIVLPVDHFGFQGGYRVLSRLATEWTRAGHAVRFVAHAGAGHPYHPTEADVWWVDDAGQRVASPGPQPGVKTGRGFFHVMRIVRALHRGLEAHARDADVVVADNTFTSIATAFSRLRPGVQKAYYIQLYQPEIFRLSNPREAVLAALARFSYRLPLLHLSNSPAYETYPALRLLGIVPPGLDLDVFKPAGTPRPPRPDGFAVGCIGRTEPAKGTSQVLDAFARLRAEGVDVRLRMAFNGPPDGYPWRSDVETVVPQNDAELADFYRSVDVVAATPWGQHGAPHYPLMESLACGVPVAHTGYMPGTDANSWYVRPRDGADLARVLQAVHASPDEAQRKVAQGLQDVQRFEWARLAQHMLDLITAS